MPSASSNPGLCLVGEARGGAAWSARVASALSATGASTLILAPPAESGAFDVEATRALVALAQKADVAALLADAVDTARAAGADGVHLSPRPDIEDAYEAARSALGPDAIVGADAGLSRHNAMTLGESGADYVAFGRAVEMHPPGTPPEEIAAAQHDLVAWWADVFVVPVVAFGASSPEEVGALAAAGADFVAVHLPADASPDADAAWAADVRAALRRPVPAA